jgi:phosphodiesterase/alkaline phosphatase D-like protein
MEQLKGLPPDQWINHQGAICEFYREVYRDTWRHPPTAKCLANCPNLMIYDDHEVRDNWGDIAEDWESSCAEFFVARCAWIVSMEYQRQLHEDVDFLSVETIKQV